MKGNVIAGLTRNPLRREIPDRVRDDKGGMTREVRDDKGGMTREVWDDKEGMTERFWEYLTINEL